MLRRLLLALTLISWAAFATAQDREALAFSPHGGGGMPPVGSDPMSAFLATVSPGHWAQIGPQGGNLAPSPSTPHTREDVVCYLNNAALTPVPNDNGVTGLGGSWQCRAAEGVWSGASYDTIDNWVVMQSGNHFAYCGNELYAFDVNNLIWMRLNTPDLVTNFGITDCSGGTVPLWQGTNGDSIPNHNYGGNGFIKNFGTHGAATFNGHFQDMSVFFGAAFALCNYTGPAPNHQIVKAPCNPTPQGTANGSGSIFNYTSHCGINVQQDMTGATDSDQQWLGYFPVGGGCSNPWERYRVSADPGFTGTSGWDEPTITAINGPYARAGEFDHCVSVFRTAGGRHQIWQVCMQADDFGQPTTLQVTDTVALTYWQTTDTSMLPPGSYYAGVAYDSKRDKIVVMPDGAFLTGGSCSSFVPGGWGGNLNIITPADPPNPPSAALHATTGGGGILNVGGDGNYPCTDGIMTRWVYDAKHDCYLLFADVQNDVWVYKPDF